KERMKGTTGRGAPASTGTAAPEATAASRLRTGAAVTMAASRPGMVAARGPGPRRLRGARPDTRPGPAAECESGTSCTISLETHVSAEQRDSFAKARLDDRGEPTFPGDRRSGACGGARRTLESRRHHETSGRAWSTRDGSAVMRHRPIVWALSTESSLGVLRQFASSYFVARSPGMLDVQVVRLAFVPASRSCHPRASSGSRLATAPH